MGNPQYQKLRKFYDDKLKAFSLEGRIPQSMNISVGITSYSFGVYGLVAKLIENPFSYDKRTRVAESFKRHIDYILRQVPLKKKRSF